MSGNVEGDDCSRRIDLRPFTVGAAASIQDAVSAIDAGRAQIALVVDDVGRLIGTVTDGDIRRGLLRELALSDSVTAVMKREFRSVDTSVTDRDALDIMRLERFHQMPVVDAHGHPVELIVLEDLLRPTQLPNRVVLMAGGEGKRLLPLTSRQPKPMLPVGDRPMLEIVLDQCISAGLHHFYISVGYLKEQVVEHFGDGSKWGVRIQYLVEDEPLGTAGAVSLIDEQLTAPLLVVNGDVLTQVDFRHLLAFHGQHQARATMCVRPYEIPIPFGVVSTDGLMMTGIEEKPVVRRHVNAGIYVLSPTVVNSLRAVTSLDMPRLLEQQLSLGPVLVFPVHEYWSDVGSHDAFEQARLDWA